MAANNLRIIYKNLADVTGLVLTANTTASSTTTPVSNILSDIKSKVYRTVTGSTTSPIALFLLDFGSGNTAQINSIVFAFTNLTSNATIRVRGYTAAPTIGGTTDTPVLTPSSGGTLAFDTSGLGLPYVNSGKNYWGTENYSPTNERVGYARFYFTNNSAYRWYVVEVGDTSNTDKYIEVSRLICGTYWSPTYNTSYDGLSSGTKDLSTNFRTDAGDLLSIVQTNFSTLSFDLKYLNNSDRTEFTKLVKYNGVRKPIFISLFPENTEEFAKEQQFQIYGKMTQLFPVDHPLFETYSSQVDVEEI